jgi:Flp pilus assembly pilin Flp
MLTNSCRRATDRPARLFSRLSQKLCKAENGQDLIEYSLLTGIIAVVGILVFPTIQSKMADAYQDWNDNAQAIWEPPPPL